MPIVVRIGGFHTLKSFLGCIGYIMADSGLEELIKLVYPGDVTHISDGGSYYKALRAHFLIDAAFCCFILEEKVNDDELVDLEGYIDKCVNKNLGVNFKTKYIQDLSEKMNQLLKNLFSNSRTAALWVTYHNMITLVKDFIRAERLHAYNMHLSAVALMLPYFAAAGRGSMQKL